MKYTALLVALLLTVGVAQAYVTTEVKEVIVGGDALRTDMVQLNIDSGRLTWYYGDNYTPEVTPLDYEAYAGGASTDAIDDPDTGGYSIAVGPEYGSIGIGLVGFQGLFDILPGSTISSADDIIAATLKFTQGGPIGGEEIGIYRVLTPWMYNAAGDNEYVVSADSIIPSPTDPWRWGDGTAAFDPAPGTDYTTVGGTSVVLSSEWGTHYELDVLDIVKGWYTDGNNGLCMKMESETWPPVGAGDWNAPYIREAEFASDWQRYPDGSAASISLVVTYTPEPATMALLAIGGIGALLRRKR